MILREMATSMEREPLAQRVTQLEEKLFLLGKNAPSSGTELMKKAAKDRLLYLREGKPFGQSYGVINNFIKETL